MSEHALILRNVTRAYKQGGRTIEVLRGVDLQLRKGEIVGLVGPSGSGKTTLLQIAGLLDVPDGGEVMIEGEAMHHAGDAQRTKARRHHLGFVYQFHHLLPEFSAVENVMLPQMMLGFTRAAAHLHAMELLETLGLKDRAGHRPAALSGGEQQRVAMARALANDPAVLLADEPTGNLDTHTAEEVFSMLMTLAKEHQLAALVATHNMELARRMDRVITLRDGALL